MSLLDQLTQQAGRIAGDVQESIKRARVQGERRLLERQHRAALEELGERAFALIKVGGLDGSPLSAQVAAVESAQMEIEAKDAEIAALSAPSAPPAGTTPPPGAGPAAPATGGDASGAGPGWDAADRFFSRNDDNN